MQTSLQKKDLIKIAKENNLRLLLSVVSNMVLQNNTTLILSFTKEIRQ